MYTCIRIHLSARTQCTQIQIHYIPLTKEIRLKIFGSPDPPDFRVDLSSDKNFVYSHEHLFQILGTPEKTFLTCTDTPGTLMKTCWNFFGCRNYFKSDLLRPWYHTCNACVCTLCSGWAVNVYVQSMNNCTQCYVHTHTVYVQIFMYGCGCRYVCDVCVCEGVDVDSWISVLFWLFRKLLRISVREFLKQKSEQNRYSRIYSGCMNVCDVCVCKGVDVGMGWLR